MLAMADADIIPQLLGSAAAALKHLDRYVSVHAQSHSLLVEGMVSFPWLPN